MSSDDALLLQNMKAMISLIDKLRDFNLHDYISLPKLAVLGEQSSGKSSLLESICGLNFLPRGSGIVTRRPLELRMVKTSISTPYFVFPRDFKDKKFTNPDEVRLTIEKLTLAKTGEKNISDDPIVLTVYSPSVPDLTLVDLPGITRIPVGDQPINIEEITKNLVRKYCEDPNTLVLIVIPANIDLSTSDALNFARQLDPQGERSLGVLTKIDIMNEGTDAKDVLLNKEIKLKYGYIGVKGRTQKEINEKMTVEKAIQAELDYFGKHPVYSALPSELLGTRSLIDKVSQILFSMIQTSLPKIKMEINNRKALAKDQLTALGEEYPESEEKKLEMVFQLVRRFKENYDQEINGKYFHQKKTKKKEKEKVIKSETVTFALNKLFSELYEDFAERKAKITKDYTDEYIRNAIEVYQGESIPGFHSFDSFLFLIHPKLDNLKTPVFNLLDEAKNILEEKGIEILDHNLKKFPKLLSEIKDTFIRVLLHHKNSARKILENLIRCEENYIFTNDSLLLEHDFVDQTKKFQSVRDQLVEQLRGRIDTYFFIVVRNLRDIVPKIIGQFLLKKFNDCLEVEILNALNKENYCLDSLMEGKTTQTVRQKLKTELNSLLQAENLLINEFHMNIDIKKEIIGEKRLTQIQNVRNSQLKEYETNNLNENEDDLEEIDSLNEDFLLFNKNLLNIKSGNFSQNTTGIPDDSFHKQQTHKNPLPPLEKKMPSRLETMINQNNQQAQTKENPQNPQNPQNFNNNPNNFKPQIDPSTINKTNPPNLGKPEPPGRSPIRINNPQTPQNDPYVVNLLQNPQNNPNPQRPTPPQTPNNQMNKPSTPPIINNPQPGQGLNLPSQRPQQPFIPSQTNPQINPSNLNPPQNVNLIKSPQNNLNLPKNPMNTNISDDKSMNNSKDPRQKVKNTLFGDLH